jgi:uncharacterized protein (DUF2164 family)
MSIQKNLRADLKRRLTEWFVSERNESLSNLGADMLLDFLDEEIGWVWYNQGIQDARGQLEKDFSSLYERLEILERMPPRAR